MSTSETITKADLKNILDEVLPPYEAVTDVKVNGSSVVNNNVAGITLGTQMQIARGWVDELSVSAGSYKDRSISFGKTFTNNPFVIVCFASSSTAGAFGRCVLSVQSITTTGCTVRVFNGDSTARSPGIYWIAIL